MITLTFNSRLISKDNEKVYNKQGRFFLSSEYKAFENKIALFAKSQYRGKVLTGNLSVIINAYFTNKVHSDAGNLSKSVCDALQRGIIYENDRQIKRLIVNVIENSEKDYFEVTVEKLRSDKEK